MACSEVRPAPGQWNFVGDSHRQALSRLFLSSLAPTIVVPICLAARLVGQACCQIVSDPLTKIHTCRRPAVHTQNDAATRQSWRQRRHRPRVLTSGGGAAPPRPRSGVLTRLSNSGLGL